MQNQDVLKIEGISKSFGVVNALNDVSFSVKAGEIHTILGENGAGKSTLIKIISGELTPDKGSILLDGQPIQEFTPVNAHRLGIQMVHQELSIFENVSVAENLYPWHGFVSKLHAIQYRTMYENAKRELERFGLGHIDPSEQMVSLTMAEQQMVEIMRCILANPKILILDEPTSSLNDDEIKRLMNLLKELRDQGITILFISHKLNEIKEISDRVTILRDGHYICTYINDESLQEGDLVNAIVGRDLSGILYLSQQKKAEHSDEVAFEVKDMRKRRVLENTSFKAYKGEIVGVFGLEGCGSNRLSRMLYGLERCDAGEVIVKGERMAKIAPLAMNQHKVMYLNNNRKMAGLLLDMAITDNVSLPILHKVTHKNTLIDTKTLAKLATDFVGRFSIALPSLTAHPRNLSGGNQQKVMLSTCLAPEPDIFIVNEPTRGIDVGAKAEIHQFLMSLARQGMTIILFSSELPELIGLCSRVMVMRNKKLVAEVTGEDINEQTIMMYAATDAEEKKGGQAQ